MKSTEKGPRKGRLRTKMVRRLSGSLALLFALTTLGLVYVALSPTPQTAVAADVSAEQVAAGAQLYANSCITCHGSNLQGIEDRGPSLIGTGQAATYFQVGTGRMPLADHGAQAPRKEPFFNPEEVDQLAAYVQANGGGPQVPAGELQNTSALALGGEMYRLNCASCHNFTGQGGALSQGKYAPNLDAATDEQIYAAMLSGPENMPKFSDGQITPEEKTAIIAFIQNNKQSIDPGGAPLGGFGPAPEGLIAFVVGMSAIVAFTLWMGSRA